MTNVQKIIEDTTDIKNNMMSDENASISQVPGSTMTVEVRYIDSERIAIDGVIYKKQKTLGGVYAKKRQRDYMRAWRKKQRRMRKSLLL